MSQFTDEIVSDRAKKFIEELHTALKERDALKIHELKESRFTDLAQEDVAKPDAVMKHMGYEEDSLVMLLYKELHTRHIYSTKKADEIRIEDRAAAWHNYLALFNKVLECEGDRISFDLPNGWLYDIIDEFVYQLQEYCRYCADRHGPAAKKDSAEEAERLKELERFPKIWDPVTGIKYLQRLIKKSDITVVLTQIKQGKLTAADVLSPGTMHVSRVWGYFAMVGLLRIHVLVGDYYQALKCVANIDFTPEKEGEKIFKKVQACHITILYYAGFAYMMMRRHYDAVRILLQALRSRSLESAQTTNQTVSNIAKMRENCAKLLAMALELAGCRPQMMGDETVAGLLAQRVKSEDREMLKQGNEDSIATFRSLFMQACPRFFTPSSALVDIEVCEAGKNESLFTQLNLFLREVRQQLRLPILRSYLKLYSTITLDKLARTATDNGEADALATEKQSLTRELMCLKHKSRQQSWSQGSPLDGSYKCLSDADFYFDREILHIDADFRRPQANSSYFVSHIETLRNATRGLNPHDIFTKQARAHYS
eukprot:TRINITY_DN30649_c0_g1_i1.p1 TRINITY_DN30649_c0_g1~~TRINITY_DN30649_c0_g1_i1.p1  ORF type:complete len:541 (+),score=110.13 TRINITY_DN30649_c0_g1_i1:148-1770(+)